MTSTIAQTNRTIEDLTLSITQEIHVRASIEVTFAALLEQLGPHNDTPEGRPLPMKLEPWPGGRWYRDLGGENGHLWGHVSYPVTSNLQYRLSEVEGGTLIKFHHSALGLIEDDHRAGVGKGWTHINEQIRQRAEGRRPQ